jgi:hypothetical protein
VFAEFAIFGAKGGKKVGVDIEFSRNFAANNDGDNDLGFSFKGTGEIARVGGDVIDDDRFAGGCGGATDALIERDAGVRGHGALEGAEYEDVAVPFPFEHVEANPIVASELFMKEGPFMSDSGDEDLAASALSSEIRSSDFACEVVMEW